MKLFSKFSTRFSTRSKVLFGTALTLVATVAFVAPAATEAALGADRETKAYTQGMAGFDRVQFNSFTGVPNIGDERQFMTGKISGASGGFYDNLNGVRGGDEMLVRVYVHNNADSSLNASGAGVAKNTRVKVVLPTGLAQNQSATAFISADNAQPQIIEDAFGVTGETPVGLQYVPGSATIKSNQQDVALSDEIVSGGVLVGNDNLKGDFKGCFEFAAVVSFKVKVTAPGYTLDKKVRVSGTTNFTEEVSVKPNDKVDFVLAFKNNGTTQLNNVALGDRLPVGLTYVPGTTEWNAGSTGNKWTKVSNDDWLKGGLNVGHYTAGAAAYLRFTAQVTDASKLECGMNQLVNHGFAKPEGQSNIQDSATVKVNRVCDQAAPVTPVAAVTPAAPEALPNVGAGNIVGLFAAVTIVAAAAHRLFVRQFSR